MYPRILAPPETSSFFLFGPRGVGKTAWLRATYPDALYVDLLDHGQYARLLAAPDRIAALIPARFDRPVVIDEIQRVPELLNEVHRLIESRGLRFVLTGSSARQLRRRGVNLLAGRAVTRFMHPLTATELGADFDAVRALRQGTLPAAWTHEDPADYLRSYTATYLREEVQQEGIARNIAAFARFLETASFSQAGVLNVASVARECGVAAKVANDWFGILEDLLLAVRLPVFARRAKRRMTSHPKLFLFDAGVYRALRPRGPLDPEEQIDGPALETLLLTHLRAHNDARGHGYALHTWRTQSGVEVDFVLYGPRGLRAFEVQRSGVIRDEDLRGLRLFLADHPEATATLVHAGTLRRHDAGIEIVPLADCVAHMDDWM